VQAFVLKAGIILTVLAVSEFSYSSGEANIMTGKRSSAPRDRLKGKRRDHELPAAIVQRGWRYHHLGVPTDVPRPGERYLEPFKMFVSGFDTSPYGIEWMRFKPGSPVSELIRTVPHIAFEVDDLDDALKGKDVLTRPNSPSRGVRVAMILHNGAPVELLEFFRDSAKRKE
jgi:hypothetical protein